MNFINRESELKFLNQRWSGEKFELIVLYGKRRVGKTELMKQFLKDKSGVYFLADKRDVSSQLIELTEIIGKELNNPLLEKYPVKDWLDLFGILKTQIKDRFILVIDEYPYLTEVDKATGSIFQKAVDEILKDTQVFLVLSGSSISMMENEVLDYTSPLYGRRTGDILLKPMTFKNAWKFYPTLDFNQFLEFFAVLGGLPAYISQFNPKAGLLENITQKILTPGLLFNEINFILRTEFREPTNYFDILRVISNGQRKFSEIANSVNIPNNQLTTYLQTLENLHLITKEHAVTDNPAKSKKGLYKIQDNFYKFWFRYIYPFKSYLEIGKLESSLQKFNEDHETNLGKIYEEVALELIWDITSNHPKLFTLEKAGRWWNNNEEIDIVGYNKDQKKILFGECKYTQKPVGMSIYTALQEKAKQVDWQNEDRTEYFILFSKSGFTEEIVEFAQTVGNLVLVSGVDLF
jgi:AAA+ ATPase superfamily predicted ATPase